MAAWKFERTVGRNLGYVLQAISCLNTHRKRAICYIAGTDNQ